MLGFEDLGLALLVLHASLRKLNPPGQLSEEQ